MTFVDQEMKVQQSFSSKSSIKGRAQRSVSSDINPACVTAKAGALVPCRAHLVGLFDYIHIVVPIEWVFRVAQN